MSTAADIALPPAEDDLGGRQPAAPLDPAAAERQELIERWAERRLAEDLADAVAAETTPDNLARLPELEGSRGALVAFVTWMMREGQQNGRATPLFSLHTPGGRRCRAAPARREGRTRS
ncbi:hypothetical protein ABZ896_12655 [Streptomyces sp. NPDC047072]|uniref:hypothetical protein n=1 Tax=Streptomyces sp. NPDC047072 TaxID=3154809 RepID=UPI0033F338E1